MKPQHQEVLVRLGQAAFAAQQVATLMQQAVALIASTLTAPQAALWECAPGRSELLLRAGVGWAEGHIGTTTIMADQVTVGGLLPDHRPVMAEGRSTKPEYGHAPLLCDHGVRASLCASICGQSRLYGLLCVYSGAPHSFSDGEAHFLQAAANILAMALERAHAEEALRQSEERSRRLAENAADIIYRYRFAPTPGFDYVNPAATLITGYTPEAFYADPSLILRLAHPDDRALLEARFHDGAPGGDPITVRLTHKDGSLVWTEQRAVPIFGPDGRLLAVEGIVRNISKRKRLEDELAKVHRRFADSRETARLFLARELHDSAVQQLLGISYQLAAFGRRFNAEQPGRLPPSEEVATTLTGLRHSILRVAREIRSLIGELRPAGLDEFGLTTALQGYVTHLSRELGQPAAVSLDLVETGVDLPRLTALCLFRVAQEALRNALKHADATAIDVRLARAGQTLVLSIRDDGCGFAVPERLSELSHDHHFGLIGMAEWVDWVDGRLAIASQPGRGTLITVEVLATPRGHAHEDGGRIAQGVPEGRDPVSTSIP